MKSTLQSQSALCQGRMECSRCIGCSPIHTHIVCKYSHRYTSVACLHCAAIPFATLRVIFFLMLFPWDIRIYLYYRYIFPIFISFQNHHKMLRFHISQAPILSSWKIECNIRMCSGRAEKSAYTACLRVGLRAPTNDKKIVNEVHVLFVVEGNYSTLSYHTTHTYTIWYIRYLRMWHESPERKSDSKR